MTKSRPSPHNEDTTDKTQELRAQLNQWGTPDWRSEEAYGSTQDWSPYRWRWEFFRRREDLRRFFDERAAATYRSNQADINNPHIASCCFPGLPSEAGFGVTGPKCVELFGYISIGNPRVGPQPEGMLIPLEEYESFKITSGKNLSTFLPARSPTQLKIEFQIRCLLQKTASHTKLLVTFPKFQKNTYLQYHPYPPGISQ